MWVIIKKIKTESGVELPVIVLDAESEIWEFPTETEASQMAEIFNNNSYSGKNSFEIKKI
jgi:hypothetical protein